MREVFPEFLLTDGVNVVPCQLSKECVRNFKEKFAHLKLSEMSGQVVNIIDWNLRLRQVDGAKESFSYGNIKIEILVH